MARALRSCASQAARALLQPQFRTALASHRTESNITTKRSLEAAIRKKLTKKFKPTFVEVFNESFMHNVPKGSETHFKVVVVSENFEDIPLVERHRLVNTCLEEEFHQGVHALSIVAKTPGQWAHSKESMASFDKSPPCRGGAGL